MNKLFEYRYANILLSKLFNSLLLFQRADKQLSILLSYDIAIQALNYHLAFISCMNHQILHSYNRMSLPTLALPFLSCCNKIRIALQYAKFPYSLYKSTLMSNGESKSFSMTCFVSFSERLACSVGIFQSIPRLSSRMLIPPSASGW